MDGWIRNESKDGWIKSEECRDRLYENVHKESDKRTHGEKKNRKNDLSLSNAMPTKEKTENLGWLK